MNEKHGPNGFLLGLLIGGAAGALISSKKGRKILKDLADYGIEYVGNTISMEDIETILNGEEEFVEDEFREEKKSTVPTPTQNSKESIGNVVFDEPAEAPKKRRLFRGIGKK